MTAIIITSIICATLLIMSYMTRVYPITLRKYKLRSAQLKAELDKLKREYDGHLDDYTDWFLSMQKRLDELANIIYDKIDEK
ncbi:hypothetical protein [uncultured Duncaniella sp.]|uniref:hypothetical protein n=1 Tax=uncultured Duncaniella sp. TaxID=2768039 RepID=UPI0025B6F43F|nr:hypothetical protein [uncultured Duncaniella sp.]